MKRSSRKESSKRRALKSRSADKTASHGNYEAAFAALRETIRREDALPYSDPPPWMQPVRHALGGLLLEQDWVREAEDLFREDLGFSKDNPRRRAKLNNAWGLHGLYECFTRQGKTEEAVFIQSARDIALATADVPVRASCYCRVSAVRKKAVLYLAAPRCIAS
ncbi:hypothetical protein ASPACDRAFT_47089 [Aspergillus aculeatus ATCC 16872]|uniref:Uncharacterized protein n=1 Tax=Aspergillus aculeatus (strain ATCC 16872 / CBS 172.66 / WB 5094) TaxID=690307 RepID=A0A1L9WJJ0_ASPA1|nr:uncharacterized protein ASPACDRAFT_47089 [Aspergillus aculeatus ATCC 16872]OJJ96321.1 hypothetical protein ASPACDRAFT_47089 [Aspergillus aculeatus ATCC 16872]